MWQRGVDTVRFNPSYRSEAMRAELSDGHPEAPLLVHVGRLGAGISLLQASHACIAFVLAVLQHSTLSNLTPSYSINQLSSLCFGLRYFNLDLLMQLCWRWTATVQKISRMHVSSSTKLS